MSIIDKPLYWLDEWVLSFKYYCYLSWLKLPSITKVAKVILSHGTSNSREANTGNNVTWYRHIQLSPWIKEHWIE